MTCHEFVDVAESLSPSQLLRMQSEDGRISAHARECGSCGRWLESQLLLGSALQTLQAHTAQREASPTVEQAVLQAFRSHGFAPVRDVAPERAAPAAWKLSRFSEFGAYAAVAAALMVGVFLGTRMWRDKQAPVTQAQTQQVGVPQQATSPVAVAGTGAAAPVETNLREIAKSSSGSSQVKGDASVTRQAKSGNDQAVAESIDKTSIDKQGFVALMLCDPLICSGDEQVIRMELPATGGTSVDGTVNQTVIADVVIGDDGLVRAMRIVN
jgi:hypothetical protein